MSINGFPDREPLKMPVALLDILAAHQIKEAILLAYINKQKNGKGSFIECSLLSAGISSLANQASNYLNTGVIPKRTGSEHPNIFPYGSLFNTSDNKLILLAIGTDTQFKKLCSIVDPEEKISLDKYSKNVNRVKYRDDLKQALHDKIINWNSKKLIKELDKNKIPAAVILDIKEVFKQKIANQLILSGTKKNKKYFGVRTFTVNSENKTSTLSAPPHLDEHRKEILELI